MDYKELKLLMSSKSEWAEICQKTKFLDTAYTRVRARQRLWHIENQWFSLVKCPVCNSPGIGFNDKLKQYSTYCNSACAQNDAAIRAKTESTCLKKFGANSNLSTKENKQKEEATKLLKYGVKSYAQTEEFKEKVKATCLAKYGVNNPSKSEIVKQKINDTTQQKYGRKRFSQCHLSIDTIALKNDKVEMSRWFNELKMPVSEISKILGVNNSQLCQHFKNNLGIDISRHGVSWLEREIGQFLTELQVPFITSDRQILKPKELDIVIPTHKLAIELNGVAWHSELRGKDKNYHLTKTVDCEKAGYRLIHIWSTEWINNNDLVKSRIKSILSLNQSIMGRKCAIEQIKNDEAKEFLINNHIQGFCQSSVKIGLRYNKKLVALMTFGKSRFNKNVEWELLRYCSLQGINVSGGASKLFSHFVKNFSPLSIISFCDRRWNTGGLYQKLGFTLTSYSTPNYWYTKKYITLESRMKYQKHKLAMSLPSFNPSCTEWENMQLNGFDRVWDCGNGVWLWKSPVVISQQ